MIAAVAGGVLVAVFFAVFFALDEADEDDHRGPGGGEP